ncbi:beta-lactamase-like protein [Pelagophyceae sp. CCMP2097]|nr:beta-lactamase-like protein [Pelagophyceae sp. CCMP2097]
MERVAYVELVGGLDGPLYVLCVARRHGDVVSKVDAAYAFGALEGSARFGTASLCGGVKGAATVGTLRTVFCFSASDALGVPEYAYARKTAGVVPLRVVCTASAAELVRVGVSVVCDVAHAVDCTGLDPNTATNVAYEDEFVRVEALFGADADDVAFACTLKGAMKASLLFAPRDVQSVDAWRDCAVDAVLQPAASAAKGLVVAFDGAPVARPSHHYERCAEIFGAGLCCAAPHVATSQRTCRVYLHPRLLEEFYDDTPRAAAASAVRLETRKMLDDAGAEKDASDGDTPSDTSPQLFFVGTGSSAPSSKRASSAIFVAWRHAHALVDCGAGTLAQLKRLDAGANQRLAALSLIWISHHHFDHCGGLPAVVRAWQIARKKIDAEKRNSANFKAAEALRSGGNRDAHFESHAALHGTLTIIAPQRVLEYWKAFERASGDGLDASRIRLEPLRGAVHRVDVGALAWTSVRVAHCRDAYGCVVRRRDSGEQLVFSGDCRPSQSLARRASSGAPKTTTLVHEATFADCDSAHALRKRHSTTAEALGVGRQMRADVVVLTHFSQRYVSVDGDASDAVLDPITAVGAAFDGLTLRTSDAARFSRRSKQAEKHAEAVEEARRLKQQARRWDDGENENGDRPPPGPALGPAAISAAAENAGPARPAPPRALKRPRGATPAARLAQRAERRLAERLAAFYETHAPTKVDDVARVAVLFSRNFAAMNSKLLQKYGVGLRSDDDGSGSDSEEQTSSSEASSEESSSEDDEDEPKST